MNCPPRAAGFDGGSVAVQSQITKLRLAWRRAMINVSTSDQAAAHAAAERDVEDRIKAAARAGGCLAQCAGVRIVLDRDRQPAQVRKPCFQRKAIPSADLL